MTATPPLAAAAASTGVAGEATGRSPAGLSALAERAAAIPWGRLAPVGLALLAAAVYLLDLTVSGYANTYYSAAAQAGSQSWAALFFGSIDAAGFITVDKPPLALWAMGLSVRVLGLSPFAVLLPQALAGVATVVVLYATVRRSFGVAAGLIAGVAFTLTPVAALMFRYNNPDAVLTLLLVAAAWAVVRSLDDERLRWVVLAAGLVGLAFLAKFLQAYLVLPAFAATYLLAARGGLRRRLVRLLLAAAVVAVSSLWWVVAVELVPARSRPYIGGSATNSVVDLLLGYDGLGRIFGEGGGPGAFGGGGGPGGGGFGGQRGWLRLFSTQWAGQVSWQLPTAAAGLVAGLVARLRAPRTDARRAGFVLWGLWAAVHVAVFSLMGGIVHPYYAVAIAPAAAALTGAGAMELWRLRDRVPWAGLVLGGALVVTAWWAWRVLETTPAFAPGLGLAALFVAVAAFLVLAVPPAPGERRAVIATRAALAAGLAAVLVGPAAYTAETIGRPIAGGDPAAGPANASFGGPGSAFAGGGLAGGGDLFGASDAVVDYLVANRGTADWLVAVSSANQAGPIQLASGVPVMAMGGFMGSDPAPTLEQLRAYVAEGRLRFVLLGGGAGPGGFFGGDGRGSVAAERAAWVTDACTPTDVAGAAGTLYDCAGAA